MRLPVVLTLEEIKKVIKSTYKFKHKLAFKLGFFCGLRVSEVIRLRAEDVDFGRHMLFIRQGKGGKDAYVPFPNQLSASLKNSLPVDITVRSLQRAFKGAIKRAGITKDAHFHSLRHSAATYYLENGMNLKEVQQLLRHSRLDTTSIYLHINPDKLKNKMDEIWSTE